MKEIIVYSYQGSDPFLYKEVDYNFSIGDYVYCELTQDEIKRVKNFYPHLDCEGIITEKWIDIVDMRILWTVDIY